MIYFMRHKHEQKGVKLLIEDQVAKSENVLVLTRDELGKLSSFHMSFNLTRSDSEMFDIISIKGCNGSLIHL